MISIIQTIVDGIKKPEVVIKVEEKKVKTRQDLKEFLKSTAAKIKATKIELKHNARAGQSYYQQQSEVYFAKREFRYHLIAYCEMRGLKREQIEKPAENNLPNESYIKQIKEKYNGTN